MSSSSSSGSRKIPSVENTTAVDPQYQFDSLDNDVLLNGADDDSGDENDYSKYYSSAALFGEEDGDGGDGDGDDDDGGGGWGRGKLGKKKEDTSSTSNLSVKFDFRRGAKHWPKGIELVGVEAAEKLIKKAEEEAQKLSERATANQGAGSSAATAAALQDGVGGGIGDNARAAATATSASALMGNAGATSGVGVGFDEDRFQMGSDMERNIGNGEQQDVFDEESGKLISPAPADAKYEVLKDGSCALILPPGYRLKLDLKGLTLLGSERVAKDERALKKKEAKHFKAKQAVASKQMALPDDFDERDKLRREKTSQLSSSEGGFRGYGGYGYGGDEKYPYTSMYSSLLGGAGGAGGPGGDIDGDDKYGRERSSMYYLSGDGGTGGIGGGSKYEFLYSSFYKQYVNEYTITIDMKLLDSVPREGISLLQTALVHIEENARTGRKKLKQSEGECIINTDGGVGQFGKFGDSTSTRLTKDRWRRVTISVKCAAEGKGQIKTWIDTDTCVDVSHESISKDGRFALDCDALYFFSSSKAAMMPGNIAIRLIKVEVGFAKDNAVINNRANDKIMSMFNEEREKELEKQRRQLSLAALFPKPRPIWLASTLVGTFGDAFIEGTLLEGSSLLSWSYTVLSHAFRQSLINQVDSFMGNFNKQERGIVSDVLYVFEQSGAPMKQMLKLLKQKNKTQLMSFLRKLRNHLNAIGVGDCIFLPARVEGVEMIIVVYRVNEQQFRFVIVQTDPLNGLQHHAVSASAGPPKLKYRTCLVLNGVSKKNALDNVFWMAVYNLAVHEHTGDMDRFYDILIPFLTGKPLESSLVDAENRAGKVIGEFGEWRSPQRSQTAYVRCLLETLHFMLRSHGLSQTKARQVSLAIKAQFLTMIENDLTFAHPEQNGQRVCRLACSQLSHAAVRISQAMTNEANKSTENPIEVASQPTATSITTDDAENKDKKPERVLQTDEESSAKILIRTKELVDAIIKKLDAFAEEIVELPSQLDLSMPTPFTPDASQIETQQQQQQQQQAADANESQAGSSAKADERSATESKTGEGDEKQPGKEGARKSKQALGEIEKLMIKVKTMKGDAKVEVEKDGNVSDLMERIGLITGLKPSEQRIIFLGKLLKSQQSLADCKINESGVMVHLVTAPKKEKIVDAPLLSASDSSTDATDEEEDDMYVAKLATETHDKSSKGDAFGMQFMDLLAWDSSFNIPDPGQASTLTKYVPVDMMQLPKRVESRDEAVRAIRLCDKLCTLIDNQSHCIKNDKFLIATLIQYVFTQLIPLPKPRGTNRSDKEERIASRSERRRERNRRMKVGGGIGSVINPDKKKDEQDPIATAQATQTGGGAHGDSDSDEYEAESEESSDSDAAAKKEKADEQRAISERADAIVAEISAKNNNSSGVATSSASEANPDFSVGTEKQKNVISSPCIWDQDIEYELQVELSITLQRIMEHFAASVLSIQQSRPFDAVCIIVPGCICAIVDSVLRRRAIDLPSEICSHLMGQTRDGKQLGIPGFGLSVTTFAQQTENIEIHQPELCVAQTAILDYFQSPQQSKLYKIFSWENSHSLKPNRALIKYLRNVCHEIASGEPAPHKLLLDTLPDSSLLMKNYPELRCFRDVSFYWKYFLNPDRTAFLNYVNYEAGEKKELIRQPRLKAILTWTWEANELAYTVRAQMAGSVPLLCRPFPDRNAKGFIFHTEKPPPTHRFPSTATPSFYVPDPKIFTEDDVIYRPNLPGFEDDQKSNKARKGATQGGDDGISTGPSASSSSDSGHGRQFILGQHDSELLISYLTVPYLRVPLVLTFFATDDRLHKLQSTKLRGILDSVLFEPGRYLPVHLGGVEPVMVPTQHPELLATPHGLLINELQRSPDTIINGICALLQGALALDTGSVCDPLAADFNMSVDIILYISRLGSRVENYLSFLISYAKGEHDCIVSRLRETDISDDCLEKLEQGRSRIRKFLQQDFDDLFEDYLRKLDDQTRKDARNEFLIDRNSRLAADLHAHKLLIYRNISQKEITVNAARSLIGSFVYLTTRHTWNKSTRESGRLLIPETELYEVLQVQRRRVVTWCNELQQGNMDYVMQSALQVSTSSTGSLRASAEVVDAHNRWSRIKGSRSVGRFAVGSTRIATIAEPSSSSSAPIASASSESSLSALIPSKPELMRQKSYNNPVGEVADTGLLGVEMDLQIGQMTLRSRHLSALEPDVANNQDVRLIFGSSTIQSSILELGQHRRRYRLVGLQHDVEYWYTPHMDPPPLGDEWERDYDPAELFDSESWIPSLFEPVRKSFFDGPSPPPMQFMMPEFPLPPDAEVAILLGLSQANGGPFKLVYLFRKLRCVHVYQIVTHGRQWWWTLHLTTDVRYCLRDMQPSYNARREPYPLWWKYGAGDPYPPAGAVTEHLNDDITNPFNSTATRSVLILRDSSHPLNLSGGQETFVPERFLYGLLPQCLLDQYRFWRDETFGLSQAKYTSTSRKGKGSQAKKKRQKMFEQRKKAGNASTQNVMLMRLRGYPINSASGDDDHVLIVTIHGNGSWIETMRYRGAANANGVEILGMLPGRTVRVIRRPLKIVKQEYEQRGRIALLLETLSVMAPPKKNKKKTIQPIAKERLSSGTAPSQPGISNIGGFPIIYAQQQQSSSAITKSKIAGDSSDVAVIGQKVKYEFKRNHFVDAVVTSVNLTDMTYGITVTSGTFAGLKYEMVDARDILLEQPSKQVLDGERVWKYGGLTDSEGADWASDSEEDDDDSSDDDNDEDGKKKKRESLTFEQIDSIPILLNAANGDEDALTDAIHRIVASKKYQLPFQDMQSLSYAVESMIESLSSESQSEKKVAKVPSSSSNKNGQETDMVLLNLLYAPQNSRLASLAKTLSRIENLSYICAWTKGSNVLASAIDAQGVPVRGHPPIDLVELPRLKLSFTTRKDHNGEMHLYSLDHADLFISNARNPLATKMLNGIPHSLLVQDTQGEIQVLVPVVQVQRPIVYSQPFTTDLVLVRGDSKWNGSLSQRYFLYPVHVSFSFLMTKGLEAALYLMLLRFLGRNYEDVHRLTDSISSDSSFSAAGNAIFSALANANDDKHPDAHACRLKISLVTIDSGTAQPWDLTEQCSKYIVKLSHVSANCRLSIEEELQLMETENAIALSEKSPAYRQGIHNPYVCTLAKNRLHALRALVRAIQETRANENDNSSKVKIIQDGEDESKIDIEGKNNQYSFTEAPCWVPPRPPNSNWPYYVDNTVFGERYAEVVPVTTADSWDDLRLQREFEDIGPPNGWLVLGCFYVSWSEDAVKIMAAIGELAPVFPSVKFLSIRADSLQLEPIARENSVISFPTLILYRDGVKVGKVSTTQRTLEVVAALISEHQTEEDVAAHMRREKAIKERAANNNNNNASDGKNKDGKGEESGGKDKSKQKSSDSNSSNEGGKSGNDGNNDNLDDEEEFDEGELQWTWDVEQCGSSFRIESLGMSAVMADEDDESQFIIWEYSTDSKRKSSRAVQWDVFSPEESKELERQYVSGNLFTGQCQMTIKVGRPFRAWRDGFAITDKLISGIEGEFLTEPRHTMSIRRKGPRVFAVGEPEVSPEQKKLDDMTKRIQESHARYKKMMLAMRKGQDVEACRGNAGFVPNTGVHSWTLKWDHEPQYGGSCDAVGLCAESFDSFGPAAPPLLGGDKESGSIGIYANGEVYHKGECIGKITSTANLKLRKHRLLVQAENAIAEAKKAAADKEAAAKAALPPGSAAPEPSEQEKQQKIALVNEMKALELIAKSKDGPLGLAPVWGWDSVVKCIFDTDKDDGVLTLEVDGVPLEGIRITNIFGKLGDSALYPAVCMRPFETIDLVEERAKRERERMMQKSAKGLTTEEEEEMARHAQEEKRDPEAAKKAKAAREKAKRDKRAKKFKEKQEAKAKAKQDGDDGDGANDQEENDNEDDGNKQDKDSDDESEDVERADLLEVTNVLSRLDKSILEQLETDFLSVICAKVHEIKARYPRGPTVTIIGPLPTALAMQDSKNKQATDTSYVDDSKSKPKKSRIHDDDEDDGSEEDEDEDYPEDEDDEEEEYDITKLNRTGPPKTKTSTSAKKKNDDEDGDDDQGIGEAKCVWMYETENGWIAYEDAISDKLEAAKREGRKDIVIRLNGKRFTVRLGASADGSSNEPEQKGDGGETNRVRRHVLSSGESALWELLSLKYKPPLSLHGNASLDIFEKIWSGKETMQGGPLGLGFLFLYCLLQGSMRCKVISNTWGDWGGGGGWGWGGGGSASKSDSHRFATLLAQLYIDKRMKSLCSSVVNVLCRNRQLCSRLPKFIDTRKLRNTAIFNGWTDEREPRSPLSALMSQVVPILRIMRRRRGAMQFPPRPPHPELATPDTKVKLVVPTSNARINQGSSSSLPLSSHGKAKVQSIKTAPKLSDFACSSRKLLPVSVQDVARLAHNVKYNLTGAKSEIFKTRLPVMIESDDHFEREMLDAQSKNELVVVDFFATWCAPCVVQGPLFRSLARQYPVARFISVDIDTCDRIARQYKVESLPTVLFFRGVYHQDANRSRLEGSSNSFVAEFTAMADLLLTSDEHAQLIEWKKSKEEVATLSQMEKAAIAIEAGTDKEEISMLASVPLRPLADKYIKFRTPLERGDALVSGTLPFDLSNHEAASTVVAQSMIARMEADIKAWANTANNNPDPEIVGLAREDFSNVLFADTSNERTENKKKVMDIVNSIVTQLENMRDRDNKMVYEILPLLRHAINFVPDPQSLSQDQQKDASDSRKTDLKMIQFMLYRIAGQESLVWIEFLFGALLSSKALDDLKSLNPYLDDNTVQMLLNLVSVCVLRANRVGMINRCIAACIKLLRLLKDAEVAVDERRDRLLPSLVQASNDLAKLIVCGRHYVKQSKLSPNESVYEFDPRYLIFEFTWNIVLRAKQVEIVTMFVDNIRSGRSKVKQMIMGAGKTTVVAPLLALMLADGESLVLSVVPKALLEMSRTLMRETFATIMQKRVYTLKCDRGTTVKPSMRRSLENAAKNRGIVVATPTTCKSIMLSFIEARKILMSQIEDSTSRDVEKRKMKSAAALIGEGKTKEALTVQSAELAKILKLFNEGVILLDEVDLILHPLKSELNFPIGEKFSLDMTDNGERWGLPIHLIDAIFYAERKSISTFEQRGAAVEILKSLDTVIQEGYENRALQRLPHITLLNHRYYHEKLKPLLADWAYLWLQMQHLHGVDQVEAIQYILEGATPKSDSATKVKIFEEELIKQESNTEGSDAYVKEEINAALKSTLEQQKLTDAIYSLDTQLEEHLAQSIKRSLEIQDQIVQVTKLIEEAQNPRDDSMDNAVVIWLSQAFAIRQGDHQGHRDAATAIYQMCTKLEDMGLVVKRFDDADQAKSRAIDLMNSGQLRCVIAGGGEGTAGCPSTCEQNHSAQGDCLVCGSGWGSHSGHTCSGGTRGSWPITSNDPTAIVSIEDCVTFAGELVWNAPTPLLALPATRVAVFGGHATLEETERIECWNGYVPVIDDDAQLMQWVEAREDWPKNIASAAAQQEYELLNAKISGSSASVSATTTTVPATEVKSEGEEAKVAENVKGSSNSSNKSEADVGALVASLSKKPAPMERSISAGTQRLHKLRERLEYLETQKNEFTQNDEAERKAIKGRIIEAFASLSQCINDRIAHLKKQLFSSKSVSEDLFNSHKQSIKSDDSTVSMAASPTLGRTAVLSLVELNKLKGKENAASDEVIKKASKDVYLEIKYLERTLLAAKVMANVSLQHKKLLNLTFDWLKTYLPHCLAKVNRVSYGLLSEKDMQRALQDDPMMPRSRLKLAVPFVGKDVPSESSEFAHPDIIIGLSILAYRYSSLRLNDFTVIVDSIVSEFSREIGPARERASSKRYEAWTLAAGGTLRGLKNKGPSWIERSKQLQSNLSREERQKQEDEADEKEVVQLKYLQTSNEEQMNKLFALWKSVPDVIHYYLQKFIFPTYMVSQRVKISASGQEVGGNMLFERRMGFSGTPSDLLPIEFGRCDYEKGDDGMMITTVLNKKTASYEFMDEGWTVDGLLRRIANAENPRFYALIDTGALITGYSNLQVASMLLKLGLEWCDGVVFLDSEDKQKVLVRATGRVVSADQCGIPLERRFAFYDQIHTTGMDIKHVVDATAVITLGKDMVFRDFVQGAFRMRGIGQGQSIRIFIIPEVLELMKRELSKNVTRRINNATGDSGHERVLEDVVAWLIINAMRSEQTQWTMLQMQNATNVYRKRAFKDLLKDGIAQGEKLQEEEEKKQLSKAALAMDKDT